MTYLRNILSLKCLVNDIQNLWTVLFFKLVFSFVVFYLVVLHEKGYEAVLYKCNYLKYDWKILFCLFSLGLIERFDGKNWTTLGKTLSVATYAHCALGIR